MPLTLGMKRGVLRQANRMTVAGTRLPPSSMSSWPNGAALRKDRPGAGHGHGESDDESLRKARPSQASLLEPLSGAPALEPEMPPRRRYVRFVALHAELILTGFLSEFWSAAATCRS